MFIETLVFNPLSAANYTICMVLRITSRNIYLGILHTYFCTSIRQSRCVTKSILCTRSSCNAIFYHTKSQLTIAQPSTQNIPIHKGTLSPLFETCPWTLCTWCVSWKSLYIYVQCTRYTKPQTQYTSSVPIVGLILMENHAT